MNVTPLSASGIPRARRGLAALGCFVAVAAMGGLHQLSRGHGMPLLIPSLAASAALLFVEADTPAAKPWNTIVGQTTSALAGYACASLVGSGSFLSVGAAAGLAVLVMQLTRSFHPPGAATAAYVVMALSAGESTDIHFVLFPVLTGAALLVLISRLLGVALLPGPRKTSHPETGPESSLSARLTVQSKEAQWRNR